MIVMSWALGRPLQPQPVTVICPACSVVNAHPHTNPALIVSATVADAHHNPGEVFVAVVDGCAVHDKTCALGSVQHLQQFCRRCVNLIRGAVNSLVSLTAKVIAPSTNNEPGALEVDSGVVLQARHQ